MKKIKIKNLQKGDRSSIFTKQKQHSVFLGNGITVYFSDLKKATAFLTRTNEFLTQKLFEINALYIDLFTEYRKAWFYFFNVYDKKMHIIGDNQVLNEIEIIEKKMTIMVSRSHFENGSSIVIRGFQLIIESMENITNTLTKLYKEKKMYSQSRQIKTIAARIIILSDQIMSWGNNMPEIVNTSDN